VLLGTTAAVYAFSRAMRHTRRNDLALWLYLASIAIGFTVLAKGLPALFAVLFLRLFA
jgi:hypothetical protein